MKKKVNILKNTDMNLLKPQELMFYSDFFFHGNAQYETLFS